MSLDLAEIHGWIVREYAANRQPAESMERLIDECSARRPHDDWNRLRQLSYADLSTLRVWIEKPLRLEPPPETLQGLWFGMFNPYYDDEPVADLYISGSQQFDPDPLNLEWATDPQWWPDDRYAHSEVMAMIYRIAYQKNGLGNDAEYPLCLGYGAFAVRSLLNGLDHGLIPATLDSVGVAVGFDSGDGILLGRFTHEGVKPI